LRELLGGVRGYMLLGRNIRRVPYFVGLFAFSKTSFSKIFSGSGGGEGFYVTHYKLPVMPPFMHPL
jgi:hypothetical protein